MMVQEIEFHWHTTLPNLHLLAVVFFATDFVSQFAYNLLVESLSGLFTCVDAPGM